MALFQTTLRQLHMHFAYSFTRPPLAESKAVKEYENSVLGK